MGQVSLGAGCLLPSRMLRQLRLKHRAVANIGVVLWFSLRWQVAATRAVRLPSAQVASSLLEGESLCFSGSELGIWGLGPGV